MWQKLPLLPLYSGAKKTVNCSKTGTKIDINAPCTFKTTNVVSMINEIQSEPFIREHLVCVKNKHLQQPTGEHFNLPGYHVHHFRASVLEKVFVRDRKIIENRESMQIRDFKTTRYGLTKENEIL